MKYILLSDDKSKILVYEYNPIPEKIYEYRKARLDKLNMKDRHYSEEPGPYIVRFEMPHPNDISRKIPVGGSLNMTLKEYEDMVRHSVCSLDFHRDKMTSDEDREKFIEAYASGELKLSREKRNDMWTSLEVYPENVIVHKLYERPTGGYSKFYVEPVFILGYDLMILNDLEEGNLRRAYYYPKFVDTQFECFEFGNEPIEEVSFSTLDLLLNSGRVTPTGLAFEHAEVLEKAGIRVRK